MLQVATHVWIFLASREVTCVPLNATSRRLPAKRAVASGPRLATRTGVQAARPRALVPHLCPPERDIPQATRQEGGGKRAQARHQDGGASRPPARPCPSPVSP